MGSAIAVVLRTQTWIDVSRLSKPFCLTVALGTTLTYCLSTPPVITRFGKAIPGLLCLLGAILFGFTLVVFLFRGFGQPKNRSVAAWLIIPVLAGCVVGYVSGGIGGADHMHHWLTAMLHISQEQAEVIVLWLRKTIHFTAYGIVAYSLFRSAIAGKASRRGAILFAILFVLCLASFDEMRQTTSPNRTGSVWDVCLDLTGAFAFAIVAALTVSSAPRQRSVA